MREELEYRDQKSNKFWHIDLEGACHTVHYGRIGSSGQRKTKEFDTPEKAQKSYDKLVRKKLASGYHRVGENPAETQSESVTPTVELKDLNDLADGQSVEMQGSAAKPYVLRNVGGVYSCSCPAWRNQSRAIERRTCKHLRALRGDEAEELRVGEELEPVPKAGGENAPPLLLAQPWDNHQDLAGWWLSEKLDGVRALWTGEGFVSRLGNPFHAPDWFVEEFPTERLDGELWVGRRRFQRTVSIVRRQDRSELWREVRFVVFDVPSLERPFEERLQRARELVEKCPSKYLQFLTQERCRDLQHLRDELARIEGEGGEGLMARQPASKYRVGRSHTLLKVKSFHDAEARVLEHQPGRGKHKGRLGSLLVQMEDGTQFSVGTGFSDAQRDSPPPLGSLITFRYQELSDGGVPRFPSFVRVRPEEV